MSRRLLGRIQPPIQWVSGALSQAMKWSGREALVDHSHPSIAEVKNDEAVRQLRTGTILPHLQ
jgi:hypothetical protein